MALVPNSGLASTGLGSLGSIWLGKEGILELRSSTCVVRRGGGGGGAAVPTAGRSPSSASSASSS